MPVEAGFHTRGYLPHLKVSGAAYFVTFRLADSLPREVVARLKEQRADLIRRAHESGCEEGTLRRELFQWYAAEVDRALDHHEGSAFLRDPCIAGQVADALRHFSQKRYSLHAWCVMPNHVHAVVRPVGAYSLDAILHSWKSYTAHKVNKLLRRGGSFWQRESYDHWVRDDADFAHCVSYTENNPVKAGLCSRASEWQWSSAVRE